MQYYQKYWERRKKY